MGAVFLRIDILIPFMVTIVSGRNVNLVCTPGAITIDAALGASETVQVKPGNTFQLLDQRMAGMKLS